MDIGTAKATPDVRSRIAHHMIDVVEPSDEFSVAEFQAMGQQVLETAETAAKRVVIAGGSGLHFRSLVDPLTFLPTDPAIRTELEGMSLEELQQELLAIDHSAPDVVDMRNPRRLIRAIEVWRITRRTPSEREHAPEARAVREYVPRVKFAGIGVDCGSLSGQRVVERFDRMIADGLLAEVRDLAPLLGRSASQAVGYKELLGVVAGTTSLADASAEAVRVTNALVKRQRTYFRRDPRIEWIPWIDDKTARIDAAVRRIGEVSGWSS